MTSIFQVFRISVFPVPQKKSHGMGEWITDLDAICQTRSSYYRHLGSYRIIDQVELGIFDTLRCVCKQRAEICFMNCIFLHLKDLYRHMSENNQEIQDSGGTEVKHEVNCPYKYTRQF